LTAPYTDPGLWVNEKEAADLSGMSPNKFKAMLPTLERLGFPKRNELNGKRLRHSVLLFWGISGKHVPAEQDDRQLERWG